MKARKKLTKRDADALSYIRRTGGVWSHTAADDLYAAALRLELAGRVIFIPRDNGNGHDIRVSQ